MEVRYVDWGLANNFGEYIELNKNLIKHPKLHDYILKHELQHTDKTFTLHDLRIDLLDKGYEKDKLKFMFKNPKSLIQFLPFYWSRNKGLVYDINMIIIYTFFLSIISLSLIMGFMI